MRFDSPLDDVFLNRSQVRVLRALYRLPEGLSASGREIARRAGITHPTSRKALELLVETGLVSATRGRVGDAYEMNHDHLLAGRLADLFRAEADIERELVSFLQDHLLALTDKVKWATIFGSVIWGESTPTSDIDLAVSCAAADKEEVEKALDDLSDAVWRRFGNHLSPLVNAKKQRPTTGIWKRIEKDGVPLIRSGGAVST
jgi:predicted nucleotidyltransferase